jgi:peptidoglycan/LPS O-acetylase OafA/YrhL
MSAATVNSVAVSPPQVAAKRIPSLDGLRAFSITLVVLGHLAVRGHAWKVWLNYPNTGVRIFFVISGYLITGILLRTQRREGGINLKEFYVRRAFRILPAAFVFTVVMTVHYWSELRWYQMLPAFLYLTNFSLDSQSWVFGHLWSLSVEEQFYFLWPAALKWLSKHKITILVASIIVAPIYQALLYHWKIHNGGYGTLPSVANNVAIGCLVAILEPQLAKVPRYAAAIMLAFVLLVPTFDANTPARTLAMLFVLQPIMHFAMAGLLLHVVQRPYAVLNCKPVVWVGQMSYSLYLWQQPFCYSPELLHPVSAIALALLCACISYYCVEQPMLRLRERMSAKPN